MKKSILLTGAGLGMAVLILGACSREETKGDIVEDSVSQSSTSEDGVSIVTDSYSLKDDGFFKDIVTGNEDPKVKSEFEYATDWSDKDWKDIDFNINRVKVVEVEHFNDDDKIDVYRGLLSLRFTLKNDGDEDISVHPNDATIILNDDSEIKATHFADYWDDIFSKDKKKDGYVHFKFDDVTDLGNIKEIKLAFDGHGKDDASKLSHTYNVTLPLKLAQ